MILVSLQSFLGPSCSIVASGSDLNTKFAAKSESVIFVNASIEHAHEFSNLRQGWLITDPILKNSGGGKTLPNGIAERLNLVRKTHVHLLVTSSAMPKPLVLESLGLLEISFDHWIHLTRTQLAEMILNANFKKWWFRPAVTKEHGKPFLASLIRGRLRPFLRGPGDNFSVDDIPLFWKPSAGIQAVTLVAHQMSEGTVRLSGIDMGSDTYLRAGRLVNDESRGGHFPVDRLLLENLVGHSGLAWETSSMRTARITNISLAS